jgi:hypothetical protein
MNEPVTTLDTRFSDADAVATHWEETRRALADAELFSRRFARRVEARRATNSR